MTTNKLINFLHSVSGPALVLFLPVAVVLAALLLWLHAQASEHEEEALETHETAAIDRSLVSMSRDLDDVVADLMVLREMRGLRRLANSDSPTARAEVAEHFVSFNANKRVFDQVRYLDVTGREVVRVNRRGGIPVVVPPDQLQNKKDRYYFRQTILLERGSVYISRFDLNEEHGRIEVPHKPVLRIATPVTDSAGRTRGILVLNYLGKHLIDNLLDSMKDAVGQPVLLNRDAYWLVGPDPWLEWGFMFPDGQRFSDTHPETWVRMNASHRGYLREPDGRYSFATVFPMMEVVARHMSGAGPNIVGPRGAAEDALYWKVATFVNNDLATLPARQRLRVGLLGYSAVVVIWLMGSLFIAYTRISANRSRALADRLSSVVEQTSDIVFITNPEGGIEYANTSFERVTGFSRAEAIGRKPSFLRSGVHTDKFYQQLWSMVLSGRAFQAVFTNRRHDGALYYEQKTISPIKDIQGRVTHLASTGKDITEQMEIQERLTHMAYHNPLTDLPNRTLFRDRLSTATLRAQRSRSLIALLFMDLDHFKNINDSLGHVMGDLLLKLVAARLKECVRESDTVAHVGGDEFAIILDDVAHVDQVTTVADKILSQFSRDFAVDQHQVFIGISIGIVLYPLDDVDIDELIKDADTALYHAKGMGRNRYEFYTADMTQRVQRRLSLETELRRAWERNEFCVHYQPVVDIATDTITSCEALLRWNHPQRGIVYAGEFMPVLEESGLIVPLTRWLLQQVCLNDAAVRAATDRDISTAANFSARSFLGRSGTMDMVTEVLEHGEMNPQRLIIEITESVLLDSTAAVESTLERLRRRGLRIAIDDFGTGYSSLSYLKRFPIDILKIDREFIRNLPDSADDAAMVTGVIGMAHALGIQVVAEGVETRAQLEFLRRLGCDSAQGFLYSPAVPPEELIKILRSGRTAKVRTLHDLLQRDPKKRD